MSEAQQAITPQKFDFKLKRIVYEKMVWLVIVDLESFDSEMAMNYRLTFMPKTGGYTMRIKNLEKEILAIENNVQDSLLPDEKEGEILERKNKIAGVKLELENFVIANPPIVTLAHLRELKRKSEYDRVSFQVQGDTIAALIERLYTLDYSHHLMLDDGSAQNNKLTE